MPTRIRALSRCFHPSRAGVRLMKATMASGLRSRSTKPFSPVCSMMPSVGRRILLMSIAGPLSVPQRQVHSSNALLDKSSSHFLNVGGGASEGNFTQKPFIACLMRTQADRSTVSPLSPFYIWLSAGYSTINDAIAAVDDVTDKVPVIRVGPGTYKERLIIQKPVVIEAFPMVRPISPSLALQNTLSA